MINKILPFKGIRYSAEKFKSAGEFVCWPYDIINKKQQEMFYSKGLHNVIRLTFGKESKKDSSRDNRYTRSKKFLDLWLEKEILKAEKEPALYLYQQVYKIPYSDEVKTVTGFISLVKIQDYNKKKILPHEDTFKKPLEDRFFLVKALNTQTCPIYSLYSDKKFAVDNILNAFIIKRKPDINYKEDNTLLHKFWVMRDKEQIRQIQKLVGSKLLYIADGHHRYHTMLSYKKYFRKKYNIPKNADHPVDYMMMFLVNSEHSGLSVLPCHRVLYNLKEMRLKLLLSHIKDYFSLKVFTYTNKKEEKKERDRFLYLLKSTPQNSHSFGVYIKNLKRYFLLTLRNKEAYMNLANVDKSITWKSLDCSIIHTLLIDYILRISKIDVSNQIHIDYTKDYNEAFDKVDNNKHQVAIILNSTPVNQVLKIAQLGEKMPQKSTYFYPKILTGLVMYKIESGCL